MKPSARRSLIEDELADAQRSGVQRTSPGDGQHLSGCLRESCLADRARGARGPDDDLAHLTDDLWAHPSLCGDWTVHDVAAHLINNAKTTRLGIVRDMLRARFDFDRQNAQGVERERGATPRETLARLRQVATRTSTPPAPLDSRLVEEVVHGEDIRRPLGIKRAYPSEAVVRSLRYQARTPVSLGGAKQLIATVWLQATDADVSIGDGPEVSGPALSLLMAISGRKTALGDLDGPGVSALE